MVAAVPDLNYDALQDHCVIMYKTLRVKRDTYTLANLERRKKILAVKGDTVKCTVCALEKGKTLSYN